LKTQLMKVKPSGDGITYMYVQVSKGRNDQVTISKCDHALYYPRKHRSLPLTLTHYYSLTDSFRIWPRQLGLGGRVITPIKRNKSESKTGVVQSHGISNGQTAHGSHHDCRHSSDHPSYLSFRKVPQECLLDFESTEFTQY
jgi:hypothetical protein